ncbi:MAG: hypothetical protein K8T20_17095 [Planctomycetes bacterium]|nr:hypothetical protein [Planctomycetota bacterium]
MAADSSGFIGQVVFAIIALGVAAFVSKARKAEKAREAKETLEQLRRVDEAILEARHRAAKSRGGAVVHGSKASAEVRPVFSDSYEVSSPASSAADVPMALPVFAAAPATSSGSEARQESEAHTSMVSEPSVAAESGSMSSRGRSRGLTGPVALAAAAGFPAATAAELREAIVWREVFGPCVAMRS